VCLCCVRCVRACSRSVCADALNDGESLYCDPKTGLVRAVEMCECPSCQRRGRIRCALCYGTGLSLPLHRALHDKARHHMTSLYNT